MNSCIALQLLFYQDRPLVGKDTQRDEYSSSQAHLRDKCGNWRKMALRNKPILNIGKGIANKKIEVII